MEEPNDFCEISTTTTKKTARLGGWSGATVSNTRKIEMRKEDFKQRPEVDYGSTNYFDERKAAIDRSDSPISLASTSRRLSDEFRVSEDIEEDARSVASTTSDKSKRSAASHSNRVSRSRMTADFFTEDFDTTMHHMIHDFDARLSRPLKNDTGRFFHGRRKDRRLLEEENSDNFFSRSSLFNRSNLSRSTMAPSLFDSTFDDLWPEKQGNLDEEYAESGVFSDRSSSRLSHPGNESLETEQKQESKGSPPDKFEVDINVKGFKAKDLVVRTEGRRLIITATKKCEEGESPEDAIRIKREFTLPEGVNPYDVTSSLMTDGFLKVEAPILRMKR